MKNIRNLTLATSNFDQRNTFPVKVSNRKSNVTCSLHRDYLKQGDGVYWALQGGAMLKDKYTAEDAAERTRLENTAPLTDKELVLIEGVPHRARVLGNYSNAAVFDPIDFNEFARLTAEG